MSQKQSELIFIRPRRGIAGKVAIVTGASSGIGEATAKAFAEAGATVVLAARRAERLLNLATEINDAGGNALAVPTDLRNRKQITNLVKTTLDSFGRIDVLANIAGWGRYDWFEELSQKDLRDQYEVNVLGLAELTRQVIPTMKAQHSGHILVMNSYASEISVPPITVYASTKSALAGLSDGLRRELLPWGIEVMSIVAGGVKDTEFNKQAASKGGIRFKGLPVSRVPKELVARRMVELVQKPRRTVHLGRIYAIPVFFNRLSPGFVDRASAFYVRWKQKKELGGPMRLIGSRLFQLTAGAAGILAALTIARRIIPTRALQAGQVRKAKDFRLFR